jgi:hypothetical protein
MVNKLIQMIEVRNELYGALFVAVVYLASGFLTVKEDSEHKGSKANSLLKGSILAFCSTYLVLYFLSNNSTQEVLNNVIATEPDF